MDRYQQQVKEKNRDFKTLPNIIHRNSKWNKDLNVRPDTIKLFNENIGREFFDINHSNIFFDPPPRIMKTKPKINKWDLIILKSFCSAKKTINGTKNNPQNGRKYLQMKQLTNY